MENNDTVTWSAAARVWWAYTWRFLVATFSASLLVGFLLGMVATALGMSAEQMQPVNLAIGLVLGVSIGVAVIKFLMQVGFGNFRLQLVQKDAQAQMLG
ncbi:MAG: hypothetical protein MJA83_01120 [Gammaproteobacteria bacterium]|nr:hypothetical protein [Gammaproteobacteria bacterium]